MQKRILAAVLGVAALAAASCSNESNRENQTYRWIGFLVDGSTATPLALKDDAKSTNQVYAVIKGEVRRAKPCEGSDDPATKLPGCFMIEDIPVAYLEDTGQTVDQIPVFAQYDGYKSFQGRLTGLASVSTEHVSEILDMQLYANIRLFPTDYQVPYRVQTNFNGRPVSDVRVVCQVRNATADKFATSGSDFLDPEDTLGGVVDVKSDGSGSANLPGPLVNGAAYHCYATRADAFEGNIIQGTLDFTAGVSAANQTINLTAAPGSTLYAVSTNNEDRASPWGVAASCSSRSTGRSRLSRGRRTASSPRCLPPTPTGTRTPRARCRRRSPTTALPSRCRPASPRTG